ncbi:hypothetical protein H1R20_g16363, partial [Candolleomyces eurysporus]
MQHSSPHPPIGPHSPRLIPETIKKTKGIIDKTPGAKTSVAATAAAHTGPARCTYTQSVKLL